MFPYFYFEPSAFKSTNTNYEIGEGWTLFHCQREKFMEKTIIILYTSCMHFFKMLKTLKKERKKWILSKSKENPTFVSWVASFLRKRCNISRKITFWNTDNNTTHLNKLRKSTELLPQEKSKVSRNDVSKRFCFYLTIKTILYIRLKIFAYDWYQNWCIQWSTTPNKLMLGYKLRDFSLRKKKLMPRLPWLSRQNSPNVLAKQLPQQWQGNFDNSGFASPINLLMHFD